MATIAVSPTQTSKRESLTAQTSGPAFDWLMAFLGVWLIGGLYLDGWAHNHNQVESFFTPWHGVLYSGFFIQAAVLAGLFARNLRRGYPFLATMPMGYGLSLLGAAIFMVGGVGDMIWHIVFGIENGVEALLSPTHLLLAIGGGLLITGPVRAALIRRAAGSFLSLLPMLISVGTFYSMLTFFTVYANPFATTWVTIYDRPGSDYVYATQAIGITGFLFQSALLAAIVLFLLRNGKLRPGHLTLLLGLNTGFTVVINDVYLNLPPLWLFIAGLAAGLVADALLVWLKPSLQNIRGLRLFAFGLPAVLFGFYFAAAIAVGLWWSIHLWTGAIALSGLAGWLTSYLLVPSSLENVRVTEAS